MITSTVTAEFQVREMSDVAPFLPACTIDLLAAGTPDILAACTTAWTARIAACVIITLGVHGLMAMV